MQAWPGSSGRPPPTHRFPLGLRWGRWPPRHKNCFLLQCEGCGAIFHMDCSHLGELYDHLLEGHGFAINPRRTMFYGLCEKCREAREAKK